MLQIIPQLTRSLSRRVPISRMFAKLILRRHFSGTGPGPLSVIFYLASADWILLLQSVLSSSLSLKLSSLRTARLRLGVTQKALTPKSSFEPVSAHSKPESPKRIEGYEYSLEKLFLPSRSMSWSINIGSNFNVWHLRNLSMTSRLVQI